MQYEISVFRERREPSCQYNDDRIHVVIIIIRCNQYIIIRSAARMLILSLDRDDGCWMNA